MYERKMHDEVNGALTRQGISDVEMNSDQLGRMPSGHSRLNIFFLTGRDPMAMWDIDDAWTLHGSRMLDGSINPRASITFPTL